MADAARRILTKKPVSLIPRLYPPRIGETLVTRLWTVNAGCDHV
ncbi:MAG TPA: hypothetical protein VG270_05415 [Pseudolabrys sp.]|nr:hypothetical protein [Pseudolabrys sp.]